MFNVSNTASFETKPIKHITREIISFKIVQSLNQMELVRLIIFSNKLRFSNLLNLDISAQFSNLLLFKSTILSFCIKQSIYFESSISLLNNESISRFCNLPIDSGTRILYSCII
jgi:hypothetical protein